MARKEWRGKRFVVGRARLDEVRRGLRVAEPVELKLTRYTNRYATVGCLIGFRGGAWRIALDTYLPPAEASRTIYHELAHILQAQRLGGLEQVRQARVEQLRAARLLARGQRRFFRARAAERIALEREAEALARRWHKQLSLAERGRPRWV